MQPKVSDLSVFLFGSGGYDYLHELHAAGFNIQSYDSGMDLFPWIILASSFLCLLVFDLLVLSKIAKRSFGAAFLQTCFYLGCAAVFCAYILYTRGVSAAANWGTGYLLEWMLAIDNLFVFHRLFFVFDTPDDQKHTVLFWGIAGAVACRFAMFFGSEALIHKVAWMHYLFGMFLIYTGIRTMMIEDEDDANEDRPGYTWISGHLRYKDIYHPDGAYFFIWTKEEPAGDTSSNSQGYAWYGTRLLLVLVCLEVTDVMFAFDSVFAIIAQVGDLYLAFSACIFAMLGLRSLFSVVDELVKLFTFTTYGVSLILIMIGVKLIFQHWIEVAPEIMCTAIVTILGGSIVASVFYDRFTTKGESMAIQMLERPRKHSVPSPLLPLRGTPPNSPPDVFSARILRHENSPLACYRDVMYSKPPTSRV